MRSFEGYLHGVNLGGWLSQKDSETAEYMDTFITEEDFRNIAGLHLDHVRIPVDYTTLETETAEPIESGYRHLDDAVRWAKKYGLHVLIDLHKTHEYSFDPLDRIADKDAFFHNPEEQERFFSLWERIASRYAADPDTVAFELLNEVVPSKVAEDWNNVADAAVKRIRAVAPKAWIVIGGVQYNSVSTVPLLHKPADDHIVYNFHCYEPMIFTHQDAFWVENMPQDIEVSYPETAGEYVKLARRLGLRDDQVQGMLELPPETSGPAIFDTLFQPALQAAKENNAPLYCGEYGVIDRAPARDTLQWLRDITSVFNHYGIGRSLWNYKEKNFGFTGAHYDDIREEMAKLL